MAKIVLDKKGVRELLRSQEMMDICLEHAEATKTAAGSEGYEISSHVGTNRVNASVRADTIETIKDNYKNTASRNLANFVQTNIVGVLLLENI